MKISKVTVLIHRQTGKEASPGTLRAWIVTLMLDGAGRPVWCRGENLLKRRMFSKIDSAVHECDARVFEEFKKHDDMPEIEYLIEDGAPAAALDRGALTRPESGGHGKNCACTGCVADRSH